MRLVVSLLCLSIVSATFWVGGCGPSKLAIANLPPPKSHHTASGFKNNYIGAVDKPFFDLLRWRFAAFVDGLPPQPRTPTPVQAPDLVRIHGNGRAGSAMEPMVTWIGHATTLVQADGLNVLTDPIFSERAAPVQLIGPKRQQPPGVALKDLPHIDVVVISHNHYDHLDRQSVFELDQRAKNAGRETVFLIPLGLKAWFANLGIERVVELDWWEKFSVGGVNFYLTPVQHWSARTMVDQSQTLWGGWAVFGPSFQWYFSGDSGYSKDFADTRDYFSRQLAGGERVFDLALLPVGAYQPRWFMSEQHMNPHEAAQTHRDLDARQSIGVHWGTFNLTDEALDQPPVELSSAKRSLGLSDGEFSLLKIGQSRRFERRRR